MTPRPSSANPARRFLLVGFGASLIASAGVGLAATLQLIEPSDEDAIGITRNAFLGGYSLMLLCGLALAWLGFRRPK